MSRKYSIRKSFTFAFSGLKTAIKKEPNFRIHVVFALITTFAAYYFRFNLLEWLILALAIFLVMVFELLNTTLEAVVDLVSPEVKPEAKIAKDVSAAAVLLTAIFSIIVGLILFLPRLIFFFL